MTVLLAAGLLTIVTLAVLAWPWLSGRDAAPEADREVAIYEDQLGEIDRDLARAVITEDQAKSARIEIERRLLAALRRREETVGGISKLGRLATITAMAAIPLGAALVYLQVGSLDAASPSAPPAIATPQAAAERLSASERHPELEAQIAGLEERLANNPEDVEGQALLARTYARLGDYEKSVRAYRVVNRLTEGRDAQLAGELAEVMVLANEGIVPDEALSIFTLIAEDIPGDPQAIYYLALAKHQNGDTDGAVADLVRLREQSPPGAPWIPTIDRLLSQIDPSAAAPQAAPRGPTPDQMAAISALPPEEQDRMIAGMVERLATRLEETPDDLEGWRRLAQAYEVLGLADEAEAAHRQVLRLAPDDPAANAFINSEESGAQ